MAAVAIKLHSIPKLIFMTQDNKDRQQHQGGPTPKPDQETLHTTDPQEHMKGPFSSTMHETGEAFETDETKREADREKDERI